MSEEYFLAVVAGVYFQLYVSNPFNKLIISYSPPVAQQPLVGRGLLIIEASQLHPDTPRSVGLLWTSYQSVAETSTSQHTALKTDVHASGRIRNRNPSKQAAADPRLRPCGHWDRLTFFT